MSFNGPIPASNGWASSQESSPRAAKPGIVPPLALNKLPSRNLSQESLYFSARYSSRTVNRTATVPELSKLSNNAQQVQSQKFKSALAGLATQTILSPNTAVGERLRTENFQKWAAAEGLDPRGRDLMRAKRAMGSSSLPASPRYHLSSDPAAPTAVRTALLPFSWNGGNETTSVCRSPY